MRMLCWPARSPRSASRRWDGGDLTALDGARKLAGLDSVAATNVKQGEGVLAGNEPVRPTVVKQMSAAQDREGEF